MLGCYFSPTVSSRCGACVTLFSHYLIPLCRLCHTFVPLSVTYTCSFSDLIKAVVGTKFSIAKREYFTQGDLTMATPFNDIRAFRKAGYDQNAPSLITCTRFDCPPRRRPEAGALRARH